MKKLIVFAFLFVSFTVVADGKSECVSNAGIVVPNMTETARNKAASNLATAKNDHEKSPSADTLIWVGRRAAYLGEYLEAIQVFSVGIRSYPNDARFFRHRGHRFITLRCFDDAISDFKAAGELIKGKPDEIEPDGLPNARNTPTSTLQSNIWYHLGLAYYLKGDFDQALTAYRECLNVSKNPDMLVATTNWLYVTLRRLGRDVEAAESIAPIKDDLDIIENDSYFRMIKMYRGDLMPSDLVGENADGFTDATILYGLGNWELINGRESNARVYFERVLKADQWSSFGFIAAEAEMQRLNHSEK